MWSCVILLICFIFITSASLQTCVYTTQNATYDLQPLSISVESERHYHLVHDADLFRNYSYYFNLCQPVHHMSLDICTNASKRPEFAQGFCRPFSFSKESNSCPIQDIIQINQHAFAYQVNNIHDECYRLSNEDGGPMEWHLYDINDPAAGIIIKLKNGDYSLFCQDESKNREIDLIFRCDPQTVGTELSNTAIIIEDADKAACHYRMELNSIWGCPVQCGIYNNALCSNKGICSYDFSNNVPKCFCYSDFEGDGCQKEKRGNSKTHAITPVEVTPLTPLFAVNDTNIQYDLTNIMEINQVIDDFETSNSVTGDYRYYFQFESVIGEHELPLSCNAALLSCNFAIDPECKNVSINNDSIGVAYRVDNNDKSCVILGEISNFKSILFDNKLPAKGISIIYEGGYNQILNVNYKFHINLECPNMAPDAFRNKNKMNNTLFEVTKYDDNTYSVHFVTPLACPIQCTHVILENQLTVCNGRGLCAMDPYDKRVVCICDDGWQGELCTNEIPIPKKHSDTIYAVIVAILLLTVGFVAMIGAMLYVKWKQRANIAYADLALRHGDLGSGLMSIPTDTKDEYDEEVFSCPTYDDPTEVAVN
eukprot:102992_1